MDQEIKNRLSKIYALADQGATEGERAAARAAVDRLVKRYRITADQLREIGRSSYTFVCVNRMHESLICAITAHFSGEWKEKLYKASRINRGKIFAVLTYLEWIEITAAYEYFRRHMAKEWLHVRQTMKLKRGAKFDRVKTTFVSAYLIASGLVKNEDMQTIDKPTKEMLAVYNNTTGGKYNRQLTSSLLLTN
jgi:hypothetical protein